MPKPEDCERPICEKSDPLKSYRKYNKREIDFDDDDTNSDSNSSNATNNTDNQSSTKTFSVSDLDNSQINDNGYRDCPISRDALGYYTWNFLHTMAIYYPDKPNDEEKTMMSQFITAFSHFYPCTYCSAHFKKDIKQSMYLT